MTDPHSRLNLHSASGRNFGNASELSSPEFPKFAGDLVPSG